MCFVLFLVMAPTVVALGVVVVEFDEAGKQVGKHFQYRDARKQEKLAVKVALKHAGPDAGFVRINVCAFGPQHMEVRIGGYAHRGRLERDQYWSFDFVKARPSSRFSVSVSRPTQEPVSIPMSWRAPTVCQLQSKVQDCFAENIRYISSF